MGSLIGFNQQPTQQPGQVYYDKATGGYYTYQTDPNSRNPFFPKTVRVDIGSPVMGNNAPVQQRGPIAPRAGVGPSMQSIYGGAVQPQTNPYPGGPTPPRPSFLPQFDINAVLARARMSNPTQAPQRPSFMAAPSINMAPQQPVGNPNSGIAALPNMTQGT